MTTNTNNNQPSIKGWINLIRQKRGTVIDHYHDGDIQDKIQVTVLTAGQVIGDVVAPRVDIAGIVCGFVVAKEAYIRPTAQIWGDVYVENIHLEQGAKLHGWFSTIDEIGYKELTKERPQTVQLPPLPPQLSDLNGHTPSLSPKHLTGLRRLQKEAIVAIAAHAELERTFTYQVTQEAGGIANEVKTLRVSLQTIQSEQAELQHHLEILQTRLTNRETQIKIAETELNQIYGQLETTQTNLTQLQYQFDRLTEEANNLKTTKTSLEANLQKTQTELETFTQRSQELEQALNNEMQQRELLECQLSETEAAIEEWQDRFASQEEPISETAPKLDETPSTTSNLENGASLDTTPLEERVRSFEQLLTTQTQKETRKFRAQISILDKQLNTLKQEKKEAIERLRDLEEQLAETTATLKDQAKEFEWQIAALEEQKETEVREQKASLEEKLAQANIVIQQQSERFERELAKVSSLKETEAQDKLQIVEAQLKDLQSELAQQEITWQEKLQVLQNQNKELNDEVVWLSTQLTTKQKDVAKLQYQLEQSETLLKQQTNETDKAKIEAEKYKTTSEKWHKVTTDLSQDLEQLKASLKQQINETDEAKAKAEKYQETSEKWHKATINLSQDIAAMQQEIKQLETNLANRTKRLKEELSTRTATFRAEWAKREKEFNAKFAEQETVYTEENNTIKQELHQLKLQQEVNQAELENLHKQVEEQRERLSHYQATLVERDISLNQTQEEAAEHKKAVYQIRQLATNRIRKLEHELLDSKRKINELKIQIEKYAK